MPFFQTSRLGSLFQSAVFSCWFVSMHVQGICIHVGELCVDQFSSTSPAYCSQLPLSWGPKMGLQPHRLILFVISSNHLTLKLALLACVASGSKTGFFCMRKHLLNWVTSVGNRKFNIAVPQLSFWPRAPGRKRQKDQTKILYHVNMEQEVFWEISCQ